MPEKNDIPSNQRVSFIQVAETPAVKVVQDLDPLTDDSTPSTEISQHSPRARDSTPREQTPEDSIPERSLVTPGTDQGNNQALEEDEEESAPIESQRTATFATEDETVNSDQRVELDAEENAQDIEESGPTRRTFTRAGRGTKPSQEIHALMIAADTTTDPKTYNEAMRSPSSKDWVVSMNKELDSIAKNGTWEEIIVPRDRNIVGCKWVYKLKLDSNNQVIKYKSRIVAKGYSQVYGEDFEQTFSPVARLTSLRILLATVATENLELHQMDADTAFLNGILEDEIFMEFPQGYKQTDHHTTGLKLIKALYGLKQSSRIWWQMLSEYLKTLGFIQITSDWGLYIKKEAKAIVYLLVYVDDVLIASSKKTEIESVKKALQMKWSWTDSGEAGYILGMKITRNRSRRTILISQEGYIRTLCDNHELGQRKFSTPLSQDYKLLTSEDPINPRLMKNYQSIVGSIMWSAMSVRPDLAFAVGMLSRFNSNPDEHHLNVAYHVLQYMNNTAALGLELGGSNRAALLGFCDADYAGDLNTSRSTTGLAFFYNNSLIAWASTRQSTVALSTCEAEYMALTEGGKELLYLRRLMKELDF